MTASLSVVILTRGDREDELAAAVASVGGQIGVHTEVVLVWNGVPVGAVRRSDARPDTLVDVHLPENLGIPEGRNVGLRHSSNEVVLFLDDDALLTSDDTLAAIAQRFDAAADLGAVSLRIVDEDGETAQRHVPRLGSRSAGRSGPVAGFLGGATAIRRTAFDRAGGYAGEFFYSMEETDLAWRLIDGGWTIWYAADLVVRHPRTAPARHPDAVGRTARNRLWLAHRALPVPLAALYLVNWFAITTVRSPQAWRTVLRAYRQGWRTRIGPRAPIRWRTVWRLTRLGRPPLA